MTELDDNQEVAGLGSIQDFASQKSLVNFDPTSQFADEAA
jgi:hypothetical protein